MSASRSLALLFITGSLVAQTPPSTTPAADDTDPVPAAPAAPAESPKLTDTEEKLAMALRSFRILQDENDRNQKEIRRLTDAGTGLNAQLAEAHMQIKGLQDQLTTVSAVAAQVDILRTQLRQTQDQLNALILENNDLRNRLAITSAPPGSVLGVPTRPGTAVTPSAPTVAPAASASTPPPADLAAAPARYHTVREGDTLSRIAREYLGDGNRWPEILEANRDTLKDERSLRFGTKLRIP
jgi:LysM repeat protein